MNMEPKIIDDILFDVTLMFMGLTIFTWLILVIKDRVTLGNFDDNDPHEFLTGGW